MKKLGLSASGLLLVSAVLTGCGGGSGGATATRDTVLDLGGATATDDTVLDLTTGFSQVSDAQYKTAAETTPMEGSVIQSNINNTPGLGIDTTKTTLNFKKVAGGQDVNLNLGDSIGETIYTGGNGLSVSVDAYKKSLTNGNL